LRAAAWTSEGVDALFRLRPREEAGGFQAQSSASEASNQARSEQLNTGTDPIIWLTIFVLSIFVGVEVISKVSSTLHTPLMSGANAIHGVILIGAILVAGSAQSTPILVLGLVAVILASINMVGGFVVTDRMLIMFSRPRRALEKPARRELDQ
jgi:H+-translocating NAD(P) transhydrogenase subunit alpha